MNERDSEIMIQVLSAHGYSECFAEEEADLIILNTCSIRAKAEQKMMSKLGHLRRLKKKNPRLRICVAGCVAQQEQARIIKKMPHVDLVLGTQEIYKIGKLLAENKKSLVAANLSENYLIPKFIPDLTKTPYPAYKKFVTIMQGCNNYCTYCVVPHTRGREISRNAADILEEIEVLAAAKVKEITLLGQNVNSYGRTNCISPHPAYDFADLLRDAAKIKGIERLRFTTSNPRDLTEKMMLCFRDIPKLCRQFHLPVQAGSNRILKKMNRKYTAEKYLELVKKLKKYRPDIVLTTDVIVGFPGESEDDFEQTMAILEQVRFNGSFSFKYSDRPGTVSAKMADKVDEQTKGRRLARFQKRQDEICLEENQRLLGTVMPVMVEGFDGITLKTRAETNHLVHIPSSRNITPGEIIPAKITFAGQHALKGELR